MSNLFEPWLNFHNPIVRQLAFAIASPNIIKQIPDELTLVHRFALHDDAFWQKQFFQYQSRLNELDQNPDELIQFLAQLKSTRLGLRFEYLMWFWLQDHAQKEFELIGHSIQIIHEKHTLGELDFLVLNKNNMQIEHWEVALKFYLAEGNMFLAEWYGLNRSDTLVRKLNHFSQKQFQFQHIDHQVIQSRYAILKGQLYLPIEVSANNMPPWINPSRRIGQWGNQVLPHYYRLSRQEWICPNQSQSSPYATWWIDGLYRNHQTQHDFMFRQAQIMHKYVPVM